MSEVLKRFIGTAIPLASKGELVPLPPEPSLPELGETIRKAQAEIETAAITVVAKAIEIGKALRKAKALVGHGNFESYVAIECRMPMRTAQSYMRLARYESQLAQLLASKNAGLAHLTMTDAFKLIEKLRPGKRKPS
ncbi:hypothetical protein AOQ73_25325 [Bradyrhizobium pachyrhizi]|uniref:DUF3102 domain-containing protein n=1 Tax=Bradyrhizobium pachyrhizi TaxID=280333 RepID=UPI0007050511|nr:DUF3102 domain-containing protein [Bradyrhizobium pachyrhizi]KRP90022.1 hypothetical protein AOQ73_25325 [Bradyrhizobium pachyrhizi]